MFNLVSTLREFSFARSKFALGCAFWSIEAGLYDYDESSFNVERSLLSRVIFLVGLHQTTQAWARMVVRPVVDDTMFGVEREVRLVERVVVAASLGGLWWWRFKEDVESLVVIVEAKKEQLMDVRVNDFVGWWLYYLTLTIGMATIFLCRTSATISKVEHCEIDDKV